LGGLSGGGHLVETGAEDVPVNDYHRIMGRQGDRAGVEAVDRAIAPGHDFGTEAHIGGLVVTGRIGRRIAVGIGRRIGVPVEGLVGIGSTGEQNEAGVGGFIAAEAVGQPGGRIVAVGLAPVAAVDARHCHSPEMEGDHLGGVVDDRVLGHDKRLVIPHVGVEAEDQVRRQIGVAAGKVHQTLDVGLERDGHRPCSQIASVVILIIVADRLLRERRDKVDAVDLARAGGAGHDETDAAGIADADADLAALEIDRGLGGRDRQTRQQQSAQQQSE